MYLLQVERRQRIMPGPERPQCPVVSSPESEEWSLWTERSRTWSSLTLCLGHLQDVCVQWSHLPSLPRLLRGVLPDTTLFFAHHSMLWYVWDCSSGWHHQLVLCGVTDLWTKKSCIKVLHRVYWAFCISPLFWGWWEVRTFLMGTINFHMWVVMNVNQIRSDQKDVLWWALNLSLSPAAHLLVDTQQTGYFWPSCAHGTIHAQHL